MITMWSERYRPQSVEDCVVEHLTEAEVRFLKHCETLERLPNLLLYGEPGTGKTTLARILCNEEKYSVHRYNGSLMGKAGIASIESMLRTQSLFHKARCILIDEIDGVTLEGQKALRAMIEQNVESVSWIFTANFQSSILDALRSRVMTIFCSSTDLEKRKVHIDAIAKRCENILKSEQIFNYDIKDVRRIAELHYPDIRHALNELQKHYQVSIAA